MIIAVIGLLITVLFLCLYIAHIKGYRLIKPSTVQTTEESIEKAERLQKEFNEVMEYSLSKALERKRI